MILSDFFNNHFTNTLNQQSLAILWQFKVLENDQKPFLQFYFEFTCNNQ